MVMVGVVSFIFEIAVFVKYAQGFPLLVANSIKVGIVVALSTASLPRWNKAVGIHDIIIVTISLGLWKCLDVVLVIQGIFYG